MFEPRSFVLQSLALLLAVGTGAANAQESANPEWPNFRGPSASGVSLTAKPPTTWSASENIAWKKKIPGRGSSSPIVVGNRVYITAATPADPGSAPKELSREELIEQFDTNSDGKLDRREQRDARRARQKLSIQKQKFQVLCYDRPSGDLVWKKTATEAMPHESHHPDHGYASASPATDGKQVFVNFGSYGLYCYDLEGNLNWKRQDLGTMSTRGSFGEGSSVALYDGRVILPWDHQGQSRIESIDCITGQTIWKTDRDEPTTWSTPVVVNVQGRKQVIQAGQNYSRGYDFETGKEIWKASGLSERPVACPAVFNEVGFFASSRRGSILQAIPLNQSGDVSQNGIAWTIKRQTPDVPSLLLSENRLYFVGSNDGILTCVNAETGDPFFSPQRLSTGGIYSSPVAANGYVFVTGRNGKTVVIRDAVTFNVVSTNDIGEPIDATIALADEELFIRGRDHLFCIRNK